MDKRTEVLKTKTQLGSGKPKKKVRVIKKLLPRRKPLDSIPRLQERGAKHDKKAKGLQKTPQESGFSLEPRKGERELERPSRYARV